MGPIEIKRRELISYEDEDVPDNGIIGQWTDAANNVLNDGWAEMMASRMLGGAITTLQVTALNNEGWAGVRSYYNPLRVYSSYMTQGGGDHFTFSETTSYAQIQAVTTDVGCNNGCGLRHPGAWVADVPGCSPYAFGAIANWGGGSVPHCSAINQYTTVDTRVHWIEINLGASYPVVGVRTQR
jgi:hypothetical protein